MTIRNAIPEDIGAIMSTYDYARQRMRRAGNDKQWINGYPSRELIEDDILHGVSYVIEDGSAIAGVFAFIIGKDPTYERIDDGQWLNDEAYGTIHRAAGGENSRGIMRLCLSFCESKISNVRADTHECNHIMRHILESNGYIRCGRIYVADGSPRVAYHKFAP